jgi:hypothetical protein
MTPAEEAHFIQLWQQGATYAAIADALGIPMGTVSSRASALQADGKIAKRPKGGTYPRQRPQGRSAAGGEPFTVHRPRSTSTLAPWMVHRLLSTVHRPPRYLGAEATQALGPLDRLRAPGHAGGAAAPGGRPWAEPQPPRAGSFATISHP